MRASIILILIFILNPLNLMASNFEPIFFEDDLILLENKETGTFKITKNNKEVFKSKISSLEELDQFIGKLEELAIGPIPNFLKAKLSIKFAKNMKPATATELIETSEKLKEEALSKVDSKVDEDCPKKKDEVVKPKEEKTEEYYCTCQLPPKAQDEIDELSKEENLTNISDGIIDDPLDLRVGFREGLLGSMVYEEYDLETGNDNWGHGLLQFFDQDGDKNTGPRKYDGDDRGRTFSFASSYKAVGTDGEFRLGLRSTLWGTLSLDPDGRSTRNPDGSVHQYSYERDELEMSLRKRFDDNKDEYLILGGKYVYETDEGFLTREMQTGWHHLFDSVIYDNQDHLEDDHTFTIYGGYGREWVNNLGNWKCRTVAEGVVGFGYSSQTHDEYEFGGRGEFHLNSGKAGNRTEDNAWFMLSVWAESLYNTQDEWTSGMGAEISTSMKAGKWRFNPYLGVQYHNSAVDDYYGAREDGENEAYHTLGIRIVRIIGK